MADITAVNPSAVFLQVDEILSGFAGAGGLALGQAVYLDPTTGTYLPTDGTSTSKVAFRGIVVSPGIAGGFTPGQIVAAAGQPVGILEHGYVAGYDLSALNFDALVYLSNTAGVLSTTAGTNSSVIGRVRPTTEKDSVTGLPGKVLYVRLSTI